MRVDAPNPMLSSDADRRGQGNRERPEKPSIDPLLNQAENTLTPSYAGGSFINTMPMLDADSLLLLHQTERFTRIGRDANDYYGNRLMPEEALEKRLQESA